MTAIEIDFEVFKALTVRRASEAETYNDVLRELLGLAPASQQTPGTNSSTSPGDWVTKGVRFPVGTEFRATYKGQVHLGRVEGGALALNGERYDTPSAAAMSITGNSVNGWRFWECRLPGNSSWQLITALKK